MAADDSRDRTAHLEAVRWARTRLETPVDVEPVKVRPWAATWRLRSHRDGEVSYLKVCAARTRYEPALLSLLARVTPDLVPAVLAIDPPTGRLLLADAGVTLRDHKALRGDREARGGDGEARGGDGSAGFAVPVWQLMLATFGQLQRAVEPHVGELLAAGVPDERPDELPAVLERLLHDSRHLGSLTASERRALRDPSASWRQSLAELAQSPVPASLQHGDLHTGNVAVPELLSPSRDHAILPGTADHATPQPSRDHAILPGSGIRFFDFGDGSIAHPFCTLLVALRVAAQLGADPAQLDAVQNSYLEVFSDLAPMPALRRSAELAGRVTVLLRATDWDRALDAAGPEHGWGDPVADCLRELLSPARPA